MKEIMNLLDYVFFFLKQKTAYEMRISDWSSDVCSSDLSTYARCDNSTPNGKALSRTTRVMGYCNSHDNDRCADRPIRDRKSVEEGKSVSVSVDHGGRRNIKIKQIKQISTKDNSKRRQNNSNRDKSAY